MVNWGEEWKLCKGDAYPESVAILEGELDIPASDFENLMTKEEKIEFNSIIGKDDESLKLKIDIPGEISTGKKPDKKEPVPGVDIKGLQDKAAKVWALLDSVKIPDKIKGK